MRILAWMTGVLLPGMLPSQFDKRGANEITRLIA
jgi:hypothetical protein